MTEESKICDFSDSSYASRNYSKDLHDWVARNSWKSSSSLLFSSNSKRDRFRDHNGVLRYVDSWFPAPEDQEGYDIEEVDYAQTGCIDMPILLLTQSNDTMKEECVTVRFIKDWQKLWNYLASDPDDEIAQNLPLFRVYLEFFFHFRTCWILIYLSIYSFLATAVINNVFPPQDLIELAVDYTYYFVGLAMYLLARKLLIGTLFGRNIHSSIRYECENDICLNNTRLVSVDPALMPSPSLSNKTNARQRSLFRMNTNNLYWPSVLKLLYSTSCKECSTCGGLMNVTKENHGIFQRQFSFYQLINVSLKFLIRHNAVNMQKINFNRASYRNALTFILFGWPFFIVIRFLAPVTDVIIHSVRYNNHSEDPIQQAKYLNDFYLLIVTFGYGTVVISEYLFTGAILVCLVALAYGAEIAFRITNTWLCRFQGLRKLQVTDELDVGLSETSLPSSSDISHVTVDDDEVVSAPIESFIQMNPLRPKYKECAKNRKKCSFRNEQIIPYISRDSYEHYLFIREYMTLAGNIWSPAIFGLLILTLYLSTVGLYGISVGLRESNVVSSSEVAYALYVAVRIIALLIYPISSLAHANAFISALINSFIVAAPDDYSILGGRDTWIGYLQSVPAVWSLYGVWITWDKLAAFSWTLFFGLFTWLLAYLNLQ